MKSAKVWNVIGGLAFLAVVLTFVFGLCGCSTSGPATCDGTSVAGVYKVTKGTQTIKDSQGTNEVNDITEAYILVAQGGCAVNHFECMGVMEDGLVQCDSINYGLDMFVGPYVQRTQGLLDFTGEGMEASFSFTMDFPWVDYTGESDVNFKAVEDDSLDEVPSFRSNYSKFYLIPTLK